MAKDSHAQILNLVKDGVLSPEEADRILEDLDKAQSFKGEGERKRRSVARAVAIGGKRAVAISLGDVTELPLLEEEEEHVIPHEGKLLLVKNPFGDIHFRGTDSREITVRFRKEIRTNSDKAKEFLSRQLTLSKEIGKDKVSIEVLGLSDSSSEESGSLHGDLLVLGNREMTLSVEACNGNVEIEALRGDVSIKNSNGDVSLKDVNGEMRINSTNGDADLAFTSGELRVRADNGDVTIQKHDGSLEYSGTNGDLSIEESSGSFLITTRSGDLEIRKTSGDFEIESGGGDIEMTDLIVGKLSISSHCGDVEIEAAFREKGEIDTRCVSGDIQLKVPSETRARIETKTRSGRISCLLPLGEIERKEGSLTGVMNSPDSLIRLRTTSGDVSLS
ncbi:MAG: DUF4097 family beta strand repeat protein [Armatimonadetes bacterium]|nr:DUF4097 family beta strand repeat protein [Armatimonadota bacterium]